MKKIALLITTVFFLVLFTPVIGGVRYTSLLFLLLWLPKRSDNILKINRRDTWVFAWLPMLVFVSFILVKSFFSPSLFWDYITSIISFFVLFTAFRAGVFLGRCHYSDYWKYVHGCSILVAIVCIIQIFFPSLGSYIAKAYTITETATLKYTFNVTEQLHSRATGTLGNPNYMGFFLFTVVVLVITHMSLEKQPLNKFMLFLELLIICYAMLLTRSRTAFISLVEFISFFWLLKIILNKKRWKSLPSFMFLIMCIGILFYLLFSYRVEFFAFISSGIGRGRGVFNLYDSLLLRYTVWSNTGIASFKNINFFIGDLDNLHRTVDNLYLTLIMRYGIFLFPVIMTFLISMFLSFKDFPFAKDYAISFLFVFLINGMIAEYWIQATRGPLYLFIIGMTLSMINTLRNEKREKKLFQGGNPMVVVRTYKLVH